MRISNQDGICILIALTQVSHFIFLKMHEVLKIFAYQDIQL